MPATEDVAGVYARGRTLVLGDRDGRIAAPESDLTVRGARSFKGGLIVEFDELRDRNAAEAVRGRTLLMRAEEARPLDEDEYFLHDLAGSEVMTVTGEAVGRVTGVYEGGGGHLLGVDDGERERLIPFDRQVIREVDVAAARIVIDPPPGLLEL